jgi:hypothetical protein
MGGLPFSRRGTPELTGYLLLPLPWIRMRQVYRLLGLPVVSREKTTICWVCAGRWAVPVTGGALAWHAGR